MIGVNGEFLFNIYMNNLENIIKTNDLISFTIIEKFGFVLPYYELVFTLKNPELIKYFNAKNTLKMQIGRDLNSIFDVDLQIEKTISNPAQNQVNTLIVRGLLDEKTYLTNPYFNEYPNYSAANVIKATARKRFTINSNVTNSKDIMTWIQPTCSDFEFIQQLWSHADFNNRFVLTSIDIKNNFRLFDITKKIASNKPDFIFTNIKPENSDQIYISSDYNVDNNTTLRNLFSSKMKQKYIYHEKTGLYETLTVDNTGEIISEASSSNIDPNMTSTNNYHVQTINMHDTYYKSEMVNAYNLFNNTALNLWVTVQDNYIDIHPCDLVKCLIKEVKNQSTENYSGLYFVSKVVRSISDKKLVTNVRLTRGSGNNNIQV